MHSSFICIRVVFLTSKTTYILAREAEIKGDRQESEKLETEREREGDEQTLRESGRKRQRHRQRRAVGMRPSQTHTQSQRESRGQSCARTTRSNASLRRGDWVEWKTKGEGDLQIYSYEHVITYYFMLLRWRIRHGGKDQNTGREEETTEER